MSLSRVLALPLVGYRANVLRFVFTASVDDIATLKLGTLLLGVMLHRLLCVISLENGHVSPRPTMASVKQGRVISGLYLRGMRPILVVQLVGVRGCWVSHAWVRGELAVAFFRIRLAVVPVCCLFEQELRCLGLLGEELREGFGEFLAFKLLLMVELFEMSYLSLNLL